MKKEFKEFLDGIANLLDFDIDGGPFYVSKYDESFLVYTDSVEDAEFLMEHSITDQIQSIGEGTACVGWSPKENRWYAWGGDPLSICGFGIGSECKKEYIHYNPPGKEGFIKMVLADFEDPHHTDHIAWEAYTADGTGILVQWNYTDKAPKNLHGHTGTAFILYPKEWGLGEWVAGSHEDAYRMACDFVNGL